MGNSFVLFDVSIVISHGQFHCGNRGHTQNADFLWVKSHFLVGKRSSGTTANIAVNFISRGHWSKSKCCCKVPEIEVLKAEKVHRVLQFFCIRPPKFNYGIWRPNFKFEFLFSYFIWNIEFLNLSSKYRENQRC